MNRPIESDYTSQVAYTRALEAYCDSLDQPDYRAVKTYHEGKPVYVSQPNQNPSIQRHNDYMCGFNEGYDRAEAAHKIGAKP